MVLTSQFKQRLVTSTLSAVGIALIIYFSQIPNFKPFFVLINALIVAMALFEYYSLAICKGFRPLTIAGIISGVLYISSLYIGIEQAIWRPLPLLVLLGALFFLSLLFFLKQAQPLANSAITIFGLIYIAVPLGCASQINYWFAPSIGDGRLWLFYVLVVTKCTDIGAYFAGKIFGKTRLAPHISPNKTIEGAMGGILAAICVSLCFSLPIMGAILTPLQSLSLGLLLSLLAQLGDLIESNLKRDAGVKDSNQLPGLGGVLDIVDSLVFTLPLVYLFMQMQIIG